MMMYHALNGCGAAIQVDAIFENGRLVDVFRDGMAPTVDKPVITACPECGKRLYLADLLTPTEYSEYQVGSVNTAWAPMQIRAGVR
jgi:hypothetical protein